MDLIELGTVKYTECSGVYRPAEDTFLLARIISGTGHVLEIGTGTGILAIGSALTSAATMAVDINPAAVECARKNAELNNVTMDVGVSDLFEKVSGSFDEIIFNPPYLPSSDAIDGSEQWDGGRDGFSVTRPFLAVAPEFLNGGGSIRLILSDLTDIGSLEDEFPYLEFNQEESEKFDFESIYAYTITVSE